MNHLIEIYKYINDEGSAIQGHSLFLHTMPSTVVNGIILRNANDGMKINNEIKGYYNTEFKLIVKAESYVVGNQIAQRISPLLTTSEQLMGNILVKQCYPYSESISHPIVDSDVVEITLDFKIMFCETV